MRKTRNIKRLYYFISSALVFSFIFTSCGNTQSTEIAVPAPTLPKFSLASSAFENNGAIPDVYSCHGGGISPSLTWSSAPVGTKSFALIMDDPDAVKVVGYVYVHWLIYNIPANVAALPENMPRKAELPDGTLHGKNKYGSPCPPPGEAHGYAFKLYALDIVLDLKSGADKETLLKAMDGHILAQAQLIGKYASP